MRYLRSSWLVLVAAILGVIFFWFRPGGVEGPRPEPVAQSGKGFDHSPFTAVLQAAVKPDGTVDYAGLRADPGPLDTYVGMLRGASPKSAPHRFKSNDDRLAYYINAYNALMLAAVRDHCPIDNVEAAYFGGGMFWRVSFLLGGEPVTLGTIESELIRSVSGGSPGVHFALVKGARGFPPLRRQAYSAAKVREELTAVTEAALKRPEIVTRKGDVLELSMIFQWYLVDFGGDAVQWLKSKAPALAEGTPKVEYQPFDWALNGDC